MLKRREQRRRLLVVLLAAATAVCGGPVPDARAQTAAPLGSIQFGETLQHVDGFGFSEAFGQVAAVQKLAEPARREVLDLLFDRKAGAGFDILRIGLDTDATIEPRAPPEPASPPRYVFDGRDGGQLWMARAAQSYGVTRFTADAWTAPAFMKTNHSAIAGSLCGLAGATCASGDWRRAFAEYLLAYVGFYRKAGVNIGSLGFSNEPDLQVSYASTEFSPAQAAEFLDTLGPLAQAVQPPLAVSCCDASTWGRANLYLAAVQADPVSKGAMGLVTAHEYGEHALDPLPTGKPVWMTEWSSNMPMFQPRWDCGGCAGGADGMYLAQDVIQAFAKGNVSAYIYWWGAGSGPASLIQVEGPSYTVAKRYFALAGLSRFVLPGAHRVPAEAVDPALDVVAFRNPDGSGILCVLNTATTAVHAGFGVKGVVPVGAVQAYVTDTTRSLSPEDIATVTSGRVEAVFPRRSMTTIVLSAAR